MNIINGAASEYELPREPKLYEDTSFQVKNFNNICSRPIKRFAGYSVREDGIFEEYKYMESENSHLYTGESKMIMDRETFIAAYNAYIKEEDITENFT